MPGETWCVYVQEWVTVYTSDALGNEGVAEAAEKFARTWQGKMRKGDWLVLGCTREGAATPATVRLRLWNLKGEYTDVREAAALAVDTGGTYVAQGSQDEAELLAYGDRMLSA